MSHRHVRRAATVLLIGLVLGCQWGCGEGEVVGTVQVLQGTAVVTSGSTQTQLAKDNTSNLKVGDVVVTASASKVMIRAGAQTHLLQEASELRLDTLSPDGVSAGFGALTLLKGAATFLLPKVEAPKVFKFQARAGSVIAAVKGTIFTAELKADTTKISVVRGEVDTTPNLAFKAFGKSALEPSSGVLREGQIGFFKEGKIQPTEQSAADKKAWEVEKFILENLRIDIGTY